MELSAPIYELKRKAKQLRREKGLKHSEALNCIANEEGFTSWSLLIHKYEDQKPKPIVQDRVSFEINKLPLDVDFRAEAIEVANAAFERVFDGIEPNNPEMTRKLWNAEKHIDDDHFSPENLPIDSDYALSLIEAFMLSHVVGLATTADKMALGKD
ncbi:hypothetical protein SAMN05421665_0513 [Yoonia rosea]|uniref:Glyoxalase-related protein domain-containing protein n=1 Tax=Yoonia rosea TaxID=287098 RepID=A0A1R3WIT8_9RHOB|nr:glyoxalase superfamily protein [Yoonia rosea]SIT77174.1 hypothetical protein SAMN05421665_0513 [Yoonia rosea]